MALNNHVHFEGRLTADPEIKSVGENTVCNFSIAVNEYAGKDKDDIVNFFNCVAWNHSANYLGKYAKKGDIIIADLRARNESYEKDGKKVTVTKYVVDEVKAINTRSDSPDKSAKPTTAAKPQSRPVDRPTGKASLESYDEDNSAGPLLDISADDLPF